MWSAPSPIDGERPLTTPLETARLRKWNLDSRPSMGSRPDSLDSSINDLLKRNKKLCEFPEIPDSASSWYTTFDRLSKKISAQKYDLWDCQAKLRTEAEKNRDLLKIIQAERRRHREVESVLTSKIESLQLELEKRSPYTDLEIDADKRPQAHLQTPLQASQQQPQQQPQQPPQQPSLQREHEGVHTPQAYTGSARQDSVNSRLNVPVPTVPQPVSEPANAPTDTLAISELHRIIASLTLENESLKKTAPEPASAQAPPSPQADNKQHMTTSPAESNAEDYSRLLASNRDLQEQMKRQNIELAQQISHYNEMRERLETLLSRAQEPKDIVPPSQKRTSRRHERANSHQNYEDPVGLASPLSTSTSESAESTEEAPDNNTTEGDGDLTYTPRYSSASVASPSVQPVLRSSTNGSDLSTISTLASSTSTPSTRTKRQDHLDLDVQRLGHLYNNLRHGKVSAEELARYEEIYQHSLQTFSERPQLHADTRKLATDLKHKVNGKHAKLMTMVEDDLF